MQTLTEDPEITRVIPDPATVLEDDKPEFGEDAELFAGALDRRKLWLESLRESLEDSKQFDPKVPILVWKGRNIIVDGIQRYRLCKELGIEPVIEWAEFPDKAAAIRERWRRNVKTVRHLTDFAKAERVYDLWEAYFKPDWDAQKNKGGRGQKATTRFDALAEKAHHCDLKRSQMGKVEEIIRYSRNPEKKMPQEVVNEMLRRLRNGTREIGTVAANFKGFDERVTRKKVTNKILIADLDPNVRTAWTGESNVVIHGDCIEILDGIPHGTIDRFVFSPPYYLADRALESFIRYGEEFQPFESWDHYCNWTLRYLVAMWMVLPEGGYLVINVDNTREPKKRLVRDKRGNPVKVKGTTDKVRMEPNPLAGQFWYHTDLLRHLMKYIDYYAGALMKTGIYDDPARNPLYDSPDTLLDKMECLEEGKPSVDCGEFIWSKTQIVAKRAATGSVHVPQRRPNNEYVLFFRKGKSVRQASTMGPDDLGKGTISSWDDIPQPGDGAQERWGDYWLIASQPDSKKQHGARYPRKLAYRMITFGGSLGDVICDPFAGTGTTLYVAARTGREYVGIEIVKNNANRAMREGVQGQSDFRAANQRVQVV